jgi:hypothetical protein
VAQQPTTEILLAEAQRLYRSLLEASVRLSTFTEQLRSLLDQLPPDPEDDVKDEQHADR